MSNEQIKKPETAVENLKPVENVGSATGKAREFIDSTSADSPAVEYDGADNSDEAGFIEAIKNADGKINQLKTDATNQLEDLGGGNEQSEDPYWKWRNRMEQRINDLGKEFGDQSEPNAIGGRKLKYDKEGAHLSLDDYGEEMFIEYASSEGNEAEIKRALAMAEGLYKDRVDLQADLYIAKKDFDKAKELIIGVKDPSLYLKMAESLLRLSKKNPELKDEIMEEIQASNPEYFEDLKDKLGYAEKRSA